MTAHWDFIIPDSEALHLFLFFLMLASIVACWAVYEPAWGKKLRKKLQVKLRAFCFYATAAEDSDASDASDRSESTQQQEAAASEAIQNASSNSTVGTGAGGGKTEVRQRRRSARHSLAYSEDSEGAALLKQ